MTDDQTGDVILPDTEEYGEFLDEESWSVRFLFFSVNWYGVGGGGVVVAFHFIIGEDSFKHAHESDYLSPPSCSSRIFCAYVA